MVFETVIICVGTFFFLSCAVQLIAKSHLTLAAKAKNHQPFYAVLLRTKFNFAENSHRILLRAQNVEYFR